MSLLESSWTYRTLASAPSPLATSRIWTLPWHPTCELSVIAVLSLYVAHAHGVLAGCLAAAAVVSLRLVAERKLEWALALLLVSYGAAPRIDAHLRAEDFVTLGLVLAALRRRRRFETPLDFTLSFWLLVVGLSLAVGLAMGTIALPLESAFTALKIVEYVVAFYAAYVLRPRLEEAFLASLGILVLIGAVDLATGVPRPFDRGLYKAEANQVGGFAVLAAAFAYGRMTERRAIGSWLLLGLGCGVVVLSQSRIALLALLAISVLQLFRARTRGVGVAVFLLVAAGVAGPLRGRIADFPIEWKNFRLTEARLAEGYPPLYSHTRNRFEV